MNIANIVYYTRNGEKSDTISLRELCLREGFELESVFYAVRDAVDAEDLINRLRTVCCDQLELEQENDFYIRFTVVDAYGNTNYLKFRKRKEQ